MPRVDEHEDYDSMRLVLEVLTLNVMHLSSEITDDQYEDAIRAVSAEVRDAPASLIAYLGRAGAALLNILARERGLLPLDLLQDGSLAMFDEPPNEG